MIERDTVVKGVFLFSAVFLVLWVVYGYASVNVYDSLTSWDGTGVFGDKLVGLENYSDIILKSGLAKDVFEKVFVNTLTLTLLFVGAGLGLGIALAILLDLGVKGSGIFQWIYFVPFGFSFVVSGNLWRWAFDPTNGSLNELLRIMGLDFFTQPWTSSPDQALYCIVIAYLWQFSGFAAVILYAGMKRVPEIQLEAAQIDGASTFKKYYKIVIPQLKGAAMTVLGIYFFYALRVFDLVYIITDGGPGWHSSDVLATILYDWAFTRNWWARASAIGTIMFFLAIVIIVPFLYFLLIRGEQR